MIKIKEKKDCCGCFACMNICPVGCISMISDDEGFVYPFIDQDKCIKCGLCNNICPIINNKEETTIDNKEDIKAFAFYSKDQNILKKCSSGGAFPLIANEILENKGVVYGAIYADDNTVRHARIDNFNDINKVFTSKYLQSNIDLTYKQVLEDLKKEKYVCFSGTPCQVEGLLNYLRKPYDNLLTCDFICHGVPSPKVWQKYLKFLQIQKPSFVSFRNKDNGWINYNIKIIEQDKIIQNSQRKDLYMNSFLSECNIRPACYDCKFKKINRLSDITMADFWGVEKIYPNMNNYNGVSLVIVHSEKGLKYFNKIKMLGECQQVDFINAIKHNSSYNNSVKMNSKRKYFFENIDNLPFDKLVNKCCKKSIITRGISKIKRILKKILHKS